MDVVLDSFAEAAMPVAAERILAISAMLKILWTLVSMSSEHPLLPTTASSLFPGIAVYRGCGWS